MLFDVIVVPPSRWPWDAGDREQQWVKGFTEKAACSDGHRSKRISVISAIESDDLLSWLSFVMPPLNGDFECHLHGGGAVVGEKDSLQSGFGC